MTLTLYLSSISDDYFYGNEVTASLFWDNKTMALTFVDGSIQTNSNSVDDQVLGTKEAVGLPYGVAFGSSFAFYLSKTTECKDFMEKWKTHWFEDNAISLTIEIPSLGTENNPFTITKSCYLRSFMLPITKGQPMKATISLSPRRS